MPAKLPKDPIINQLNNTVEGETTTSIPTKTDSRSSSTQKRMYAWPSSPMGTPRPRSVRIHFVRELLETTHCVVVVVVDRLKTLTLQWGK